MVGTTRNAAAVAEFELVFHEIDLIANPFNLITTNTSMHHKKFHLQDSFGKFRRITLSENVAKLLDYAQDRQHPYDINVTIHVTLHNILQKNVTNHLLSKRLLDCIENGETIWKASRKERLVNKVKEISAKITKQRLANFSDQPGSK